MQPLSEIARITLLEQYLVELDEFEAELSPPLRFRGVQGDVGILPTGVREFASCHASNDPESSGFLFHLGDIRSRRAKGRTAGYRRRTHGEENRAHLQVRYN